MSDKKTFDTEFTEDQAESTEQPSVTSVALGALYDSYSE